MSQAKLGFADFRQICEKTSSFLYFAEIKTVSTTDRVANQNSGLCSTVSEIMFYLD